MSQIRLCSWFRVYGSLSRKYIELNHRMVIIAGYSDTVRGLNNKRENDFLGVINASVAYFPYLLLSLQNGSR